MASAPHAAPWLATRPCLACARVVLGAGATALPCSDTVIAKGAPTADTLLHSPVRRGFVLAYIICLIWFGHVIQGTNCVGHPPHTTIVAGVSVALALLYHACSDSLENWWWEGAF